MQVFVSNEKKSRKQQVPSLQKYLEKQLGVKVNSSFTIRISPHYFPKLRVLGCGLEESNIRRIILLALRVDTNNSTVCMSCMISQFTCVKNIWLFPLTVSSQVRKTNCLFALQRRPAVAADWWHLNIQCPVQSQTTALIMDTAELKQSSSSDCQTLWICCIVQIAHPSVWQTKQTVQFADLFVFLVKTCQSVSKQFDWFKGSNLCHLHWSWAVENYLPLNVRCFCFQNELLWQVDWKINSDDCGSQKQCTLSWKQNEADWSAAACKNSLPTTTVSHL